MSHMESDNILSHMQFGFRKHRSAELQLLQTIHDLSYNLNAESNKFDFTRFQQSF